MSPHASNDAISVNDGERGLTTHATTARQDLRLATTDDTTAGSERSPPTTALSATLFVPGWALLQRMLGRVLAAVATMVAHGGLLSDPRNEPKHLWGTKIIIMLVNYSVLIFLFVRVFDAESQRNVGDSCADRVTNTAGVCRPVNDCQSARIAAERNGVQPTFCAYNTFGSTLICCLDNSSILQKAPDIEDRPIWGNVPGSKRVSERKCEEYSRGVVERVDYIPLVPDPEAYSITAAKCDYAGVELIVGGENAVQGEFPHMAAIGWANFEGGYSFPCGGSLISPRFVLTAGHCIKYDNAKDPDPVVVRLGDQNIDPSVNDGADPIDIPIRRILKHPDYRPPKVYNDIALMELAADVEFKPSIRPACLWTRSDFGSHTKALATGWGVTDTRSQETSKELQKVSLSLLENKRCDRFLEIFKNRKWDGFVPSQMCAGELRGGKDTCQGDSGSPLQVASKDNQCIFYVIGVTSFGRNCAEPGHPAVYTRVSSYLDWIERTVWPGE